MKNPIRKSMFRSPIKTLLKLGIITLALYFFISSVLKLYVINRETERIGSYYKSIGILEALDHNSSTEIYVSPKIQKIINESEYIDFENSIWTSQGIVEDIYNCDFYFNDAYPIEYADSFSPMNEINNADHVFIGKIELVANLRNSVDDSEGLSIVTVIEKNISGHPEYGIEGDNKEIVAMPLTFITNRPLDYITDQVLNELRILKLGHIIFLEDIMTTMRVVILPC